MQNPIQDKADHIGPAIITFNIALLVALVILVVALGVSFLSRSVSRIRTWFAFLISFVVNCISFLLLLGRQTGPEPPLGLCVFQASLVYAAPPLAAAATFLFVIELYLRLTAITLERRVNERVVSSMVWVLPFFHLAIFCTAGILGLLDLSIVERGESGIFCHLRQNALFLVSGITTVAFCALMLILKVYTFFHLLRNWYLINRSNPYENNLPLKLYFRTSVVVCSGVLAIIVAVIINRHSTSLTSIYVSSNLDAAITLIVALTFGLQTDILLAFAFWRRNSERGTSSI